jgi:catechol 2,3-dioxygenase-like lactoylglutathione lyase family enzyme
LAIASPVVAQPRLRLHHVGLNSVDPDRAIAWYLKLWPTAKRTTFAGYPAVEADMLLLFNKVATPPPGAWRDDLHRAAEQSAFWHIGAFINSTDLKAQLAPLGIVHLPLFTSATDSGSVWRSGLASSPARDGGFSYVVAPDGVLFELTGGPGTKASLSHIHFFHEQPLCAANWYVKNLGMALPTGRDTLWNPCAVPESAPTWPALEPAGTIRQPQGTVQYGNGSMSWYAAAKLVPSRGQVLDHVAFTTDEFDALYARLRAAGVRITEPPHALGDTRAFMLEDPDRLSIEIVERKP